MTSRTGDTVSADAITLPADTVWPIPTLGVAIVQGEMRHCDGYEKVCPFVQYWCDTDRPQGPLCLNPDEAQFVAPLAFAQYDKPCENVECGDLRVGPCSLCGNAKGPRGRRMWTVRWPCHHPTHAGRMGYLTCSTCGATSDPDSGYRWRAGSRSARATIQVVPVVDFDNGLKPDVIALVVKEHAEHACVLWMGDGEPFRLPFDPLPTPGRDFAVIVRLESA